MVQPTRKEDENRLVPFLLALLPLVGGIVYVALRGTYVKLYDRFGITPEDAGISPYSVLTGAVRVFALGNFRPFGSRIPSQLLLLFILFLPLVLLLLLRTFKRPRWLNKRPLANVVTLYFVISLVFIFGVFQFGVIYDFSTAVSRIRDGQPVRPGDFWFLQVQAYHADVQWLDRRKPPAELANSRTLLYLGHADNQLILYNYCTRRTWRIPDNTVLVDLDTGRASIPCG